MKTSCFRKYKGDDAISIALYAPENWKGSHFPALAPSRELLNLSKYSNLEHSKYIEIYREEVLSKLNPKEVYEELKDKVLLCWENPGEFCHRRIVAEWLEDSLGVEIPEWNKKDDKQNIAKTLF